MIKKILNTIRNSFYIEILLRFAGVLSGGVLLFTLLFLGILKLSNDLRDLDQGLSQLEEDFLKQKLGVRDFLAQDAHGSKFYELQQSPALDQIKAAHQSFQARLALLQNQADSSIRETLGEIGKSELQSFETILEIAGITTKMGFKNWGLEGRWRKNIHELEEYIKEMKCANKDQYLIRYLQLRRNEKDYLARKEDPYIQAVYEDLKSLSNLFAKDSHFGDPELGLLRSYSDSMHEYLLQMNVRKRNQDHLALEEGKVEGLFRNLDSMVEGHLKRQNLILALLFLGFVIFFVTALVLIMKKQAKLLLQPIETMREIFTKVSHGDLGQELDLKRTDEFLALQNEFNIMVHSLRSARAQFKMATIGEISADIAHDVSNPLAIIMFYIEKLANRWQGANELFDQGESLAAIEKIKKSVVRIERIISSIKTLARQSEGSDLQLTDMAHLAEESLFFVELKLKKKGVAFRLEKEDGKCMVQAHPTQLSQVIVNLISNAIDAIETLDDRWILLKILPLPKSVEISITDSGPGIPEKIRQNLFKVSMTTKEQGKGTGLGLIMAKQIIDAHGGEIFVEPGKNTKFVIRLPLAEPQVIPSTEQAS